MCRQLTKDLAMDWSANVCGCLCRSRQRAAAAAKKKIGTCDDGGGREDDDDVDCPGLALRMSAFFCSVKMLYPGLRSRAEQKVNN